MAATTRFDRDQGRFEGFELVPGLPGPSQGSTRLTGRLSSPRRVGNATERRGRPLKLGTTASLMVSSPALIGGVTHLIAEHLIDLSDLLRSV
jgi:hypothetical protein